LNEGLARDLLAMGLFLSVPGSHETTSSQKEATRYPGQSQAAERAPLSVR
jgi:hypothetical protein